jgi:phosphatidylethanolamine/phosphatidyl-N-methylethanolamine N-methyltransferase
MSSNSWNRLRYTLWSPGYDLLVGRLNGLRQRSIEGLELKAGERLLIVGAGTGLDLPLLPTDISVLASDLTPAMLARARPRARPGVELRVMDAQQLELPDASFDAALLHLILAIVPDPLACLRETARVVRPGGRIAVFDKFVADGEQPSLLRRAANAVAAPLATDLTRRLGDLLRESRAPVRVEADASAWRGFFRIVRLRRL